MTDEVSATQRYLARRREQARRYRERRRGRAAAKRRAYTDYGRGREWVGVDGEGWGVDDLGRQEYPLMVAASEFGFEDVLYSSQGRLSTERALEWLCWLRYRYEQWRRGQDLRRGQPRFCGYALGYDHAHILMDLDLETLREVFHSQDAEAPWVVWPPDQEVQFHLKLTGGRLQVKRFIRGRQSGYCDLWDVFRYFQSAFLKAAEAVMTPEERERVVAGKARRGSEIPRDVEQEIQYALTEMKVLSKLMRTVEEQAHALDLRPNSWYGPGSMATLALKQQRVGECYRADDEFTPEFIEATHRAFVGGRFETTGHGRLPFLMQNDIKSAYPHAISQLPCLAHTDWSPVRKPRSVHPHGLYRLRWSNHGQAPAGGWGPWPSRVQPGKVVDSATEFNFQMLPMWPWSGEAWVWGWEYAAGLRLLEHSPWVTVEALEGWVPFETCEHRPFHWVPQWYERRRQMQADGDPRQMWLKLILNSLYGKTAQQVGRPQWHSWIWAGLITSHCRAALLDAIALDPEGVVMTATDAVYGRRGLDLDHGDGLGQWETQALEDVLVVQSGFFNAGAVYGPRKPRTRGIPARYIDWSMFQVMWDRVLAGQVPWDLAKVVVDKEVETGEPFQIHVGIGLAQLWGKPEKLGRWEPYPMEITFVTDKRPFEWEAPASMRAPEWKTTQPWYLPANPGAEYRPGRGIGEDKLLVMDQENADEWGEI